MNAYRRSADFTDGKPWLLRFFDQIRFFPVSDRELLRLRQDFPPGRYRLQIEDTTFSLREYAGEAAALDPVDAAALELPADARAVATPVAGNSWKVPATVGATVAKGEPLVIVESRKMEINVPAPCAGKVVQVCCREGAQVTAGQALVILERI